MTKVFPKIIYNEHNTALNTYKDSLEKLYLNKHYILRKDVKIIRESRAALVLNWSRIKSIKITNKISPLIRDYSKYGDINNAQAIEEYNYYYDTIFKSGKFDRAIKLINLDVSTKKAIINFTEPPLPSNNKIPSCMSYIWLRVNNNRLIMDCHMRANNAYRFLLINLDINNIIHSEASARTNISIGQYCHFVDSLHIYKNELESVKKYLKLI